MVKLIAMAVISSIGLGQISYSLLSSRYHGAKNCASSMIKYLPFGFIDGSRRPQFEISDSTGVTGVKFTNHIRYGECYVIKGGRHSDIIFPRCVRYFNKNELKELSGCDSNSGIPSQNIAETFAYLLLDCKFGHANGRSIPLVMPVGSTPPFVAYYADKMRPINKDTFYKFITDLCRTSTGAQLAYLTIYMAGIHCIRRPIASVKKMKSVINSRGVVVGQSSELSNYYFKPADINENVSIISLGREPRNDNELIKSEKDVPIVHKWKDAFYAHNSKNSDWYKCHQVSFAHEWIHYHHFIKDPLRVENERNAYRHSLGLIGSFLFPNTGTPGINEDLRGKVSAMQWSQDGEDSDEFNVDFEELRTVAGCPENIPFHKNAPVQFQVYQTGDSICENAFRRDLGLSPRGCYYNKGGVTVVKLDEGYLKRLLCSAGYKNPAFPSSPQKLRKTYNLSLPGLGFSELLFRQNDRSVVEKAVASMKVSCEV